MLIPVMVVAQDNVISEICGIKFGYAYTAVEKALKKQFGKPYETLSAKNQNILYQDKNVDGVVYDDVDFRFSPHAVMGGRLNEVNLMKKLKSSAEVDAWLNNMKNKHRLYIDEKSTPECTIYRGGISPLDDSKYGFKIIVMKMDNLFNIDLTYGPYGY